MTVQELLIYQIIESYNHLNGLPTEFQDPIIRRSFNEHILNNEKQLFNFVVKFNLNNGNVDLEQDKDIIKCLEMKDKEQHEIEFFNVKVKGIDKQAYFNQ